MVADALTRKEDTTEKPEEQKIFLQTISIEQAKKEGYHPSMEISEVQKNANGRWEYRGVPIIEDLEERKRVIERCHNNERAGHPGFKETLRQVREIAFWDTIRKEIARHVAECQKCQKERETHKTGTGGLVGRPEEV